VGGIPEYGGNVYIIHPLVVDPPFQNQGIGRRLIEDFEQRARERRALTILLGTDDIVGQTSLIDTDLYTPGGTVPVIALSDHCLTHDFSNGLGSERFRQPGHTALF
jgi:GNAT superfamily N-acetyltransferase